MHCMTYELKIKKWENRSCFEAYSEAVKFHIHELMSSV